MEQSLKKKKNLSSPLPHSSSLGNMKIHFTHHKWSRLSSYCTIFLLSSHICKIYVFALSLFNPLNAELNLIRHLLALVGARHIVHVSKIRVNGFFNLHFYITLFTCLKLHVSYAEASGDGEPAVATLFFVFLAASNATPPILLWHRVVSSQLPHKTFSRAQLKRYTKHNIQDNVQSHTITKNLTGS